jgi:glycerol kinase
MMSSESRVNSHEEQIDTNKIYEILTELQSNNKQLEQRIKDVESQIATNSNHQSTPGKELDLIGAIDQGTTSTRFLIFNTHGEPVASHQVEFTQYYPHPGWHEHDPIELVTSAEACIDEACAALEKKGFNPKSIKSIGITNQRETTVVWDSETGKPLHNAIVWTDTRASAIVRRLKEQKGSDTLAEKCGLPLSTYPSVTKLLWFLENVQFVKEAYKKGTLAFGTVDSWLTYRLNGGPKSNIHVSDPTNASRTMFMNLSTLSYDPSLLSFFGIDDSKIKLPKIVLSAHSSAYGKLASTTLAGTAITGVLGDQSAALVGQKAFAPGKAKNTYGTGCFLLQNVGNKPVISKHGLLGTVGYAFEEGKTAYALEGSIAVAGSAVKWLVNNMKVASSSQEVSTLAETVSDTGGVVFVTAFSGLFAPYWIDDVRGTLCKSEVLELS